MFGYELWRRDFVASLITPEKPESVSVTPEEWERGVRVWASYCTHPNIGDQHVAMCMRLVGPKA